MCCTLTTDTEGILKPSVPLVSLLNNEIFLPKFSSEDYSVYSHGLPLWKRLIAAILFDCMSQECWGAKCLQLHPVIAFWEWPNDCSRTECALIALLSSPSPRSQRRRLKSHYSKMPVISRWSGYGDSVLCGVLYPESAIHFVYFLCAHLTGTVANVTMHTYILSCTFFFWSREVCTNLSALWSQDTLRKYRPYCVQHGAVCAQNASTERRP